MTTEAIPEIRLPLISRSGKQIGAIAVSCLADSLYWNDIPQLIDTDSSHEADQTAAPIQLLEDCEYHYVVESDRTLDSVQPSEIFDPDDTALVQGRLKPGRRTGTLLIEVEFEGEWASTELEVRSRKLNYLSEYRWMLQRVADEATELLLQQFAPSRLHALEPGTGDPRTIYPKFAFISALLDDQAFEGSIQQILRHPHHAYLHEEEPVHPSKGLRPGRRLSQELVAPGPRLRLPSERRIGGMATVPTTVSRQVHITTTDTVPNRFVLYALKSWRDMAEMVLDALSELETAAALRGQREARRLRDRMERLISDPMFADVGLLTHFPSGNQVLQRRDGYRDVYRAFLQAEAAAALTWHGGEDLFAAGQRNVAAMYEFWTFLELARVIESLPGFEVDRKSLLAPSKDGMSLDLRHGQATMLTGHGYRLGRRLNLRLWFNRTFGRSRHGSWTETMRPDCSLEIIPSPALTGESSTWLHFDAKYRVGSYKDLFRQESDEESETESTVLSPLTEDLMKMHAYRDAIRRTSGAYVLYPGGDENPPRHTQYHEILPGLGAFVMRPTEQGVMASATEGSIRSFIDEVLTHVAAGGTSQERADFWTQKAYGEGGSRLTFDRSLTKPPADTTVLLGYVKSDDHLAWIQATRLYNLRADGRRGSVGISSPELGADFVLLYRPSWTTPILMRTDGAVFIRNRTQMIELKYPDARGQSYACLGLAAQVDVPVGIETKAVMSLAREGRERAEWAAPRLIRWTELSEPSDRISANF